MSRCSFGQMPNGAIAVYDTPERAEFEVTSARAKGYRVQKSARRVKAGGMSIVVYAVVAKPKQAPCDRCAGTGTTEGHATTGRYGHDPADPKCRKCHGDGFLVLST